ncbi:glycosyltransferase [Microvirga zambiensis]|uniref:glycosyltransferase n=1 Tax=Microvirga zambiensis TaxID=1402137 RepID=UPI00191F640B|nr:glycosyltransferase [Microvirga zambiensis]
MSTDGSNEKSGGNRRLTVLLVATRDLRGQLTGRKSVLRTTVESLVGLGHRVIVAHFGADTSENTAGPSEEYNQVRHIRIDGPRPWELMIQLCVGFLPGRKSLNECLYFSKRAQASLRDIVRSERVDVVITDMVRTAVYGESLRLPWIADLDDLLSLRYSLLAKERRGLDGLLGYHKAPAIRSLSPLVRPILEMVLRREAAILVRREIAVAQQAGVTLTVSPTEAETLAFASSRSISTAPLRVKGPARIAPFEDRRRDLVFLGAFSYQPNRDAVQTFDSRIRLDLNSRGLRDIDLHVVGEKGIGYDFSPSIRFEGYVDDLDEELQKYKAMLVPELLQGGIKTKVVHAALNGTVVLAHESAITGMGMESGVNVLTWKTSEDLAGLLKRIRGNDENLPAIAENARVWAEANFGQQRAETKWKTYLASVIEEPASASAEAVLGRGRIRGGHSGPSQVADALGR